ncbi:DUF6950 family protein [Roseicyclus marinus]|uniref:DUF6950 family protein n=1 Tax=Roseicyclus marinus TaxID=2161673 RepID=UPI00240F8096|nr:hypothetical protein [Roseicyclus marinus]MDG3040432.1 hypothetical protein [Roseicyclus marinus]
MGMTRVADWDLRLVAAIEDARSRPFAWGRHDCLTWAFDVRSAITGQPSLAEMWRGRYRTEGGALRLIKKLGHVDLQTGLKSELGAPLLSPKLAQRGDIAITHDKFPVVAIVVGAVATAPGPDGAQTFPLREAAMAWRI